MRMTWKGATRKEMWVWARRHWLDVLVLGVIGFFIVLGIAMELEAPRSLVWIVALLAILNHYRLMWMERRERKNAET